MPNLNLDLLEPNDNTITIEGETLKVHRVPLYVVIKASEVLEKYSGISKEKAETISQDEINKDFHFLAKCLAMVLKASGNPKEEDWILERFDLVAIAHAMNLVLYVDTQKKRPMKTKEGESTGDE